jgi:hypothetical protein
MGNVHAFTARQRVWFWVPRIGRRLGERVTLIEDVALLIYVAGDSAIQDLISHTYCHIPLSHDGVEYPPCRVRLCFAPSLPRGKARSVLVPSQTTSQSTPHMPSSHAVARRCAIIQE